MPDSLERPFFVCDFTITGRICEMGPYVYGSRAVRFVIACDYPDEAKQESLHVECVMIVPKDGHLPKELIAADRRVIVRGYRRACTWVECDGTRHYQVDHVVEELEASA